MRRMRRELREYYALLKSQRDDLLRVQLQKERLMSFVVHDLKNPVNSMDLNAQLILRDGTLSPFAKDAAQQIRRDARQLVRLIMNLLDLSKGDEGKLAAKRAPVNVGELISRVLEELRANADARSVRLDEQIGVETAQLDEDLFRRVLANLVENAVRHAPRDSAVRVSCATFPGEVEFRIADAGTGVPEHERTRIFDPFVQIEGRGAPTTRSGRGLGLAFCRLAVEAHGGRIWVEDGAPGAVFCARIPDGC
jgi:signal transduction histidine kinase